MAPTRLRKHRAVRWLLPVGVLAVVAGIGSGVLNAGAASDSLPDRTAAQLLADLHAVDVSGFSGTVVSQLSLGLPQLPALGNTGDGTSFTSLLTGSHTVQIWYGGPDKQRVALLGTTDETDLFHNGRDLWQWSSADRTAVHTLLPARHGGDLAPIGGPVGAATPGPESLTPSALASHALAAIDPSTRVDVADNVEVADRAAYQLVLTPRSAATRVASVRISLDGRTKLPLGVTVYARGSNSPAIDVAFTSIRLRRPADTNFRFTPPSGAKVRQSTPGHSLLGAPKLPGSAVPLNPAPARAAGANHTPSSMHVVGTGWTAVAVYRGSAGMLAGLRTGPSGNLLRPVSGAWGSGRLLESALFSALLTDDGRVLVGAVNPEALYAAAGAK